MNILFITVENYRDCSCRSIYMDMIKKFVQCGNHVTVLSACEERDQKCDDQLFYHVGENCEIQKVLIPNLTKMSNYVLKGINLLRTVPRFDIAAKKAMRNKVFDLVIYGSPPISVYKAVKSVKRQQNAFSYLMLKDIWPYDCLFGGALSMHGWKKIAYLYLAHLARKLYRVSDFIGCMSPANIRFLTENEPGLDRSKIGICPNCVTPFSVYMNTEKRNVLRDKYGIPKDKVVYIYGGNLGVAQGIEFAIESVIAASEIEDAFFVFVGSGTEISKLERVANESELKNFLLLPAMPKDEYETLVFACDVGLIYLNYDCLAPNYPSRLLSYMQASIPILCATDLYTDIGRIAIENGYGLQCNSNNVLSFIKCLKELSDEEIRHRMGKKAYEYMMEHYTSERVVRQILERVEKVRN